jgi:hypothetical protein
MREHHLLKSFNWREQACTRNEIVDEYCERFCKDEKDDEVINLIRLFNSNKEYRAQIEAMLLAGMSNEECAAIFDVTAEVIEWYKKIYYDVDVKNSPIEILEAATKDRTENGRRYKTYARRYGKEMLLFMLGYNTEENKEAKDKAVARVSTSLLSRCLPIDITPHTNDKAMQFMFKALDSYLKLEAAREETTISDLTTVLADISKSLEKHKPISRKALKDLL